MESQQSIRGSSAPANKLVDVVERLRLGHAVLSKRQFIEELASGRFEIWALPADAYALITWGTTEHGETCYILTVTGESATGAESGLLAIEAAARKRGARVVASVGRPGWKPLVIKHGYKVTPKILMIKVLES